MPDYMKENAKYLRIKICFLFLTTVNFLNLTIHYHYPHCNPLQGNYRVDLLYREIPVVITGNEFKGYNFLLFWLHSFPCFINIEIVALVSVMCTGNWHIHTTGFEGLV